MTRASFKNAKKIEFQKSTIDIIQNSGMAVRELNFWQS